MYYLIISLFMGMVTFLLSVTFKNKKFKKTWKPAMWVAIACFAMEWLALWGCNPVISFRYGTWMAILIIPAIFSLASNGILEEFNFKTSIPLVIIGLGLFVSIFLTVPAFHHKSMQKMLDVQQMSDSLAYIRDMAEIKPESMILVDNELAMKYAEATLEQDPATGSIYEIRDMSIQNIDGTFDVKLANGQKKTLTFHNEQVYVAPLEYRDFFKWRIKRRTPGYILVSAQKQNVVYFVTEVEGKPL
jgi:hypothetical protein